MSQSPLKLLTAMMIVVAAALVPQPAFGGFSGGTLVITENSSTSLTAILNGTTSLPVNNTSSDHWTITLAGANGGALWAEPEDASLVNFVQAVLATGTITVISDSVLGLPGMPDGTTSTFFTLNGSALSVTYFDKGDVATVPDTGMTFSLFGLSLAGLGFLRRKIAA